VNIFNLLQPVDSHVVLETRSGERQADQFFEQRYRQTAKEKAAAKMTAAEKKQVCVQFGILAPPVPSDGSKGKPSLFAAPTSCTTVFSKVFP